MSSATRSARSRASLRPIVPLGLFLASALCGGALLAQDVRLRVDDDDLRVSESAGTVSVVVRKDGEGSASVQYSTVDGSATATADYSPVSGTLSWAAGDEGDRSIQIGLVDDGDSEGSETFSVLLSSPSQGAEIDDGKDRVVVTILDDETGDGGGDDGGGDDGGGDDGGGGDASLIKFDKRSALVSEGSSPVLLVVERSKGEDGAVQVEYTTVDGTAQAPSDYSAASGSLSWAAGDGSDRIISVSVNVDAEDEGQESFRVELTSISGNGVLDATRSTITVFVNDPGVTLPPGGDDGGDDDRPGTLKFDQRTFTSLEGAPQAVISVERSRGEGGAVSVRYATSDGTAVASSDYVATDGVLEWAPGDGGVRSFTIDLVDDDAAEGSETVQLELFSPTGGASVDPVRGTAVLNILDDEAPGTGGGGGDDDRPGTLKFSERAFQVVEGAGSAVVAVERSRGGAGAVSVTLEAVDGSATSGLDYSTVVQTLTWGAFDEGTRFVEIPVLDDSETEGNEVVNLRLVAPTGGAILDAERSESTLTILDDDSNLFTCVPGPSTVCLQGGRFAVDVVWRTGQGTTGRGLGRTLSDSSAILWFFSEDNVEVLIKVLDACSLEQFGAYWVFYAATTDVDFTLRVTDTETGLTKEYGNLLGQKAEPIQDFSTFDACGF